MIGEAELNRINIARKRAGRKPLTHTQAKRAVEDNSAFDTFSLLATYVAIADSPPYDSSPSFSGGGGDFGGGGASGDF